MSQLEHNKQALPQDEKIGEISQLLHVFFGMPHYINETHDAMIITIPKDAPTPLVRLAT